jgi:hypothetical protein
MIIMLRNAQIDGVPHLQTAITDTKSAQDYMAAVAKQNAGADPNDLLYSLEASQDYDQNPVCRRSGPRSTHSIFRTMSLISPIGAAAASMMSSSCRSLFWRVRDCAERYARFGVDLRDARIGKCGKHRSPQRPDRLWVDGLSRMFGRD